MVKVLIVDDDPDAQEILGRIVKHLGFDIQTADDGIQALELVHEEFPDLIFLDLMMPRMDGFNALARLRATPRTRSIPVIVVTAYAPRQIDMLRLPGVTAVVQKGTFTVSSLRELVTETLDEIA